MKTIYVSLSLFAILLVLMSGALFMSGGGAYARYASTKTQSQANTNNCNNGTNCAVTSPQTQGDSSASSPTSVQISKFNEENSPGVGGEPNPGAKGFLQVKKVVNCPTGFQCLRPGPSSPYKMKVDVSGGVSGLG